MQIGRTKAEEVKKWCIKVPKSNHQGERKRKSAELQSLKKNKDAVNHVKHTAFPKSAVSFRVEGVRSG